MLDNHTTHGPTTEHGKKHKPNPKAKPPHKVPHKLPTKAAHKPHAHRQKVHVKSKKASADSKKSGGKFKLYVFSILAVFVIASGLLAWREHDKSTREASNRKKTASEGPIVDIIKIKKGPPIQKLTLEAEARPYFESTVYAKVSGYLKEIRVIEGSVVKTGDILAVINSPETDQGFYAAEADAKNKSRVARRYRILLRQKLVAPQEAEQYIAAGDMAVANLRAQAQLKEYEILRAPFDGVVSARYVDPGALIPNASNSKSGQLAVVTVSDTKQLKVDAFVDQKYAPSVHHGMPAEIYLTERSNERFKGQVARVSGTLDHKTRMLFTEIDFDNKDGKIEAGSFVQVEIKIPMAPYMTAPVETLVTSNGKPAVAEVLPDHHLKFHPIEIADNDGTTLTIANGVREGEQIALNVGAELKDGDLVTVASTKGEDQQGDQQKPDPHQQQVEQDGLQSPAPPPASQATSKEGANTSSTEGTTQSADQSGSQSGGQSTDQSNAQKIPAANPGQAVPPKEDNKNGKNGK
jgi:membrane fusion protein, multidrug efflux system